MNKGRVKQSVRLSSALTLKSRVTVDLQFTGSVSDTSCMGTERCFSMFRFVYGDREPTGPDDLSGLDGSEQQIRSRF